MITINFQYKLKQSDLWKTLALSTDDYFELEKNEEANIRSLPRNDKLIDYIENDRDSVDSIIIRITDTEQNESLTFQQKFWNNQCNSFLESIENKQGSLNIELILTSLVQDEEDEVIWEVIRMERKDSVLTPTLHTFISEKKDFGVSENVIVPERE